MTAATVPSFWRLVWMLFMQPIQLDHRLRACGIDEPGASAWHLWRAPEPGQAIRRTYVRRMGSVLCLLTPGVAFAVAGIMSAVGYEVKVGPGAWGVAWGVAAGVACGVAWSLGGGVVWGVGIGVAWGVAWSMAKGIATSVAAGVALGVSGSISGSVASGVLLGVLLGVGGNVAAIMAGAGAVVLMVLRLPLYAIEILLQSLLYGIQRFWGVPTLRLAPVLHHDLSYLPHPVLVSHILLAADTAPALARQALDACARVPGQRRAGRAALARLQARELITLARERHFAPVVDLQGTWLPGVEGADSLLLALREAARYLAAAPAATFPYHRLQHLERATQALDALANQTLQDHSPLARAFPAVLATWRTVLDDLRATASAAAAHQLPNPFRAGDPLTPEEGREVFRGREAYVRQIEVLLADPQQRCSIALLGPRRCGKTSLLRMLPALLPDTVCVFFDLQDNPVDSPAAFFRTLARQAQEQARRDRRLTLPGLPEGAPFEAGSQWLQRLDELPGGHRILFCLDEFERLEDLFPGDRRELVQLMGLLRATIQHRRRVRVLVSGAAPFDELNALWYDHFINVREVRLGYLDEATSRELLQQPIADFPAEAIPLSVAETIFARTAGQPFLLQLYGSLLVTLLNDSQRRQACQADVETIEHLALSQATYYFRDTVAAAPPEARAALDALAWDKPVTLAPQTRRWLQRRLLLSDDDRLLIPALGAWMRAETEA